MNNIGIIAGNGDYPLHVINVCVQQNRTVYILALKGQCTIDFPAYYPILWCNFGEIGKTLAFFKKHKVHEIIFAGNVTRPSLSQITPDLEGIKWLAKLAPHMKAGDDQLLSALGRQFENAGFKLLGSHDLLQDELFFPTGTATLVQPDKSTWDDIKRGAQILNTLSQHDIGQAVIVQQGLVLGIEAIEGTEELIRRCKNLARPGAAGVMIKMAKTQQSLVLDLPTIGPDTIQQLHDSGFAGLAIESNKVQILNKQTAVDKANELGLFIEVFDPNDSKLS